MPFADGFDVVMQVAEFSEAETQERLFARRKIKDLNLPAYIYSSVQSEHVPS